jgi:NADH-quinone oxidoreductase subunit E
LQDIQAIYGYVPDEAVQLVAQELSIFPVEIYGVLTFYTNFI